MALASTVHGGRRLGDRTARAVAPGLLVAGLAASVVAQEVEPAPDLQALDEMSLEQLMGVEVTVLTHQEIPIGSAPAALFVITRQDIQRSGLSSVPELLRLVPGMIVTRLDASRWAIGMRGFVGEYTNKLLVLIDGRSVYTPLFGGVHWDVVDLDLEDVERIEVIRGPGGARWGANAVNGVINVITRHSADTQGGNVQTTIGTEDRIIANVRYGGALDDDTTWRAYARYIERDAQVDADGSRAEDGMYQDRFGARIDHRHLGAELWSLQGDVYSGISRVNATFPLEAPPYSETGPIDMDVAGGYLLGRYSPELFAGHRTTVQAFFDANDRAVPGLLSEHRRTFDIEVKDTLPAWEGNRVTVGFDYRRTESSIDETQRVDLVDPDIGVDRFSGFVEDEIEILDNLQLILGAKLEHNEFTGFELQPDARVSWQAAEVMTLWGGVSRAVHTPTFVDEDFSMQVGSQPGPGGTTQVALLRGNSDLQAEQLWSYEVGARWRPTPSTMFDLATFYADYDDLVSQRLGTPIVDAGTGVVYVPLDAANDRIATSYGVELIASWEVAEWWSLNGSYSYVRVTGSNEDPRAVELLLPDADLAPRNQFQLHSHHSMGAGWSADLHAYFYDRMPAAGVDEHLRLDLHLGWRPNPDMRLEVALQNLLDDHHPEFAGELFGNPTEVQRSASFTVTHRF